MVDTQERSWLNHLTAPVQASPRTNTRSSDDPTAVVEDDSEVEVESDTIGCIIFGENGE